MKNSVITKLDPNNEMGQKARSNSQYIQKKCLSESVISLIKEKTGVESELGYIITFGFFSLDNVIVESNGVLYSFSF